jgi:lipopolysaccharide/colanic/teichoic acid biosynthesis glycosyltransferase
MALGLFLILLPLMAAAALITLILCGKWPIVKHTRIGQFGEPFGMLKLRTMWGGPEVDAPFEGIKPADDPRVSSRFARFCRRSSVDELPQLLHVISGKMSFVGPRPLTQRELERYYGSSAAEVLRALPGLTGLWQVKGRSRLSYRQRRRLDLFLVRHSTIRLRAAILWRTVPQVLAGKDSW